MKYLLLFLTVSIGIKCQAESVKIDKLPVISGAYQIEANQNLPEYWVLEREISLSDAKAVSFYLNAPRGTRAYYEVTALSQSRPAAKRKKIREKRRPGKTRARSLRTGSRGKSWNLDLIQQSGKVSRQVEVDSEVEALGFVLPDACSNGTYLLRLVIDFTGSSLYSEIPVYLEYASSESPHSQATLFKFPSEKSSSHAVILMRTTGVGPEYLHFTRSSGGVPQDLFTLPVDNYYFSGAGTFTRVYMGTQYMNNQKASMHHISADYRSIYSVCVSLSPRRQQLEGY